MNGGQQSGRVYLPDRSGNSDLFEFVNQRVDVNWASGGGHPLNDIPKRAASPAVQNMKGKQFPTFM
jgi:hypothetical protein